MENKYTKEIINVLIGIWCCIVNFISPIWISMIFLCLSGMIYNYDYTMDEGTAPIFGIIILIVWMLLVLIPNVYLGRKLYVTNRKYFLVYIICVIVVCICCFAKYEWNIMTFYT